MKIKISFYIWSFFLSLNFGEFSLFLRSFPFLTDLLKLRLLFKFSILNNFRKTKDSWRLLNKTVLKKRNKINLTTTHNHFQAL